MRGMRGTSLLVANRGEVAIRVMRAAAELGLRTVAVFSEDDADSLHTRRADESRPLAGTGPAAYLDAEQLLALAREADCQAVHPGYGFLSESADFAVRVAAAGLRFVGPRAETLALLGDKTRARALAERCGVPLLRGSFAPVSLEEARGFLASLGSDRALAIKAVAGGGGRGLRTVRRAEELDEAYARCRSEAGSAFGDDTVYVEEWIERARHIEIQVIGDGTGAVSHLGERECTLQRRNQKLVELAPSPGLSPPLREKLTAAAVRMAENVAYRGLGTFEFLVAEPLGSRDAGGESWAFIEANPRLQVEHTVTEAIFGVDLVKAQLEISEGQTLAELGLTQPQLPPPRGCAVQVRINLETLAADGTLRSGGGTLTAFEVPSGPGLRVDSFGYVGYTTNPRFDSLLAKLIGHVPSGHHTEALSKVYRALCEFRIAGVETNIAFLQNLLQHPDLGADRVYTRFVDDHLPELVSASAGAHRRLFFDALGPSPRSAVRVAHTGARIDDDPLAVLEHGKTGGPTLRSADPHGLAAASPPASRPAPAGTQAVLAPMQGTLVEISICAGETVHRDQPLFILEAMKMEHVVAAPLGGVVRRVDVGRGDAVPEGFPLAFIEPAEVAARPSESDREIDLEHVRADLAEVRDRHARGHDALRPAAVARRRATGQRTARENIEDLCDPGSFVEYGALVIAAQRRRRTVEDLIESTPADGLVAGIGRVNGALFEGSERVPEAKLQCIAMSYDYTVLAGTQGAQNHRKKDRMFELAESWRLPVVFFTEGGGGRPGDTDGLGVAGLDCLAFQYFGRLSGLVPLVGITSGRCFAGNAALLGCCDVVIATAGSNIGMGGPAMIEGGGLGVFRPEEVGPMDVQVPNGVVDVAVRDEAEAVAVARKYLAFFQGPLGTWSCADQRRLRSVIPENRLRIYDVREVVETLADEGSLLELRRDFGLGMVTALARIEGRPLGVIANNPRHLAGAIDSDGADKAARFMQLCDAFDLPILSLCDTPGIMVGPEVEKTALVRHACRMFVTGASLSVPFFTIVLRKGYGLGAQAMAAGSFKAPVFTVSWPTGEFGGMGLEGAVKLGFRKELAAVADREQRKALFDEMVERMYAHGKAVNMASHFEIDDVIDPADSRRWITRSLAATDGASGRVGKKRPCIDTW